MLNTYILTAIMLFCVIGIYFTLREIISIFSKSNAKYSIIIEVTDNDRDIEGIVRGTAAVNPRGEIMLVPRCSDNEINEIIYRLAEEYSLVTVASQAFQHYPS